MADKLLNLFIPITKVDAAKRLVYGVATAEQIDLAGEICDYASTKPFYEAWSQRASDITEGKSLGNVRAMHGSIAAGKLSAISFNDEAQQIEVCAKVVDEAEWLKVEDGVYTGFSQGGKYVNRWQDENKVWHYTADPIEISLVDVPCLPSATFSYIKAAGGAPESRHFISTAAPEGASMNITNQMVTARAEEMAKAAAGGSIGNWPEFIEAARKALEAEELAKGGGAAVVVEAGDNSPPVIIADEAPLAAPVAALAPPVEKGAAAEAEAEGPEWEQVWKTRDGQTFPNKTAAKAHAAELKKGAGAKPLDAALAGLSAAIAGEPAVAPAISDAAALAAAVAGYAALPMGKRYAARRAIIKAAFGLDSESTLPAEIYKAGPKPEEGALEKSISLYGVANMLQLLSCIEDAEESLEMDSYWGGVNAPDELKTRFGAVLVEFGNIIAEALDAVLAAMSAEESTEALARAAGPLSLVKAGARHSKSDQTLLQSAHDALGKMGAVCDAAKVAGADELAKAAGDAELRKQVDMLSGDVEKAVAGLNTAAGVIADLQAQVKKLGAQPINPGPPAFTMKVFAEPGVSPMNPAAAGPLGEAVKAAQAGDVEGTALALFKASQTSPMRAPENMAAPVIPAAAAQFTPPGGPAAAKPAPAAE